MDGWADGRIDGWMDRRTGASLLLRRNGTTICLNMVLTFTAVYLFLLRYRLLLLL